MKKLDKLIIKSFVGPFVATFFITVFVLIMQFMWLWIDDFVGKGLDAFTIMQFIWYQSAALVPLALPLSILLSSLMTFGNLGETFELVAIKSAGISLLRFMRPLFVVAGFISVGAFLFSNYVIPVANLKSRTLLADIVLAKPAFDIKEGVFYDKLEKFAIKIGKKESDSIIRDVIVYEQENNLQDNFLVAKDGIMKPSPDRRFLDIVFKNGWRYQERGNSGDSSTEYIRLGFKAYKMQLDISAFSFKKSDDSANANNEKMYNIRQLDVAIDSMARYNARTEKIFNEALFSGMSLLAYKDSATDKGRVPDSILNFKENIAVYLGLQKEFKSDSLKKTSEHLFHPAEHVTQALNKKNRDRSKTITLPTDTGKDQKVANNPQPVVKAKKEKKDANSFDALIPDSARQIVRTNALNSLGSVKTNIEMSAGNIEDQSKALQKYKIEWHRKIALALACLVLFMIGAPLGSIIRKGGLGTPMIFAIIFFMIFYFVSTRGEKLAKEEEISAFTGMWLSTFVLVPIGVFLIYKAMHDSNLFNKEFYFRLKRTIQKRISRKRTTSR